MKMNTGTAEAKFRVERGRVILSHAGGSVIITRNDDGSLDGPLSRMTKRDRSAPAFSGSSQALATAGSNEDGRRMLGSLARRGARVLLTLSSV